MPKTASFGLAPSTTLLARLMVSIDRLLMAHAKLASRIGEPPYFGL